MVASSSKSDESLDICDNFSDYSSDVDIETETGSDKSSYTSGSENDEEDLIRVNNTKSNGRAVGSSPRCIRKRLARRIQKNLKNTIYYSCSVILI